jgi:hypothetical protein
MHRPVMRHPRIVAATTFALVGLLGLSTSLAATGVGVAATGRHHHPHHHHHHHAPRLHTYNKCPRSAIDVPSCGVLWGAYRTPVKAKPYWKQHYGQFEHDMGRRFDIVKNYNDWAKGDVFPTRREAVLAQHGRRILYDSWNAQNYSTQQKVSYASIAAGDWDQSVILPEARRLKAYHQKVFIDFNHEFDSDDQSGSGTPQQFVAAWRHIHNVMAAAGVHNVIWSWVTTGWKGNLADIKAGYPGPKYVNWIGWDPYVGAYCDGHTGPSTAYEKWAPFYHWAAHQPGMRHKPFLLGEYSVAAQAPNARRWYASIGNALRRLPRLKALMQFSGHTERPCSFALSASPAAMAGFATAANSRPVTGPQPPSAG